MAIVLSTHGIASVAIKRWLTIHLTLRYEFTDPCPDTSAEGFMFGLVRGDEIVGAGSSDTDCHPGDGLCPRDATGDRLKAGGIFPFSNSIE
jgi:hypothetical protein